MAESVHPDRAAIESGQLEQLRALVSRLIPANKFYARKLQAAGLGADLASLQDFSTCFPFTTKDELVADQLASPPFGTNLTCPLDRYTRFHQTSGTTGTPLQWLDTPENWAAMLEGWTEIFRVSGVGPGDRVMFAFSFGPFLGFWLAFESAAKLGCLCLPGGGLSSAARLRLMSASKANVLCCTPTYALRLAEVAAGEKILTQSLGVEKIIVAGEPGGSIPATRAHLEALWPGARIFDHHGMTETGPVTYECPARPCVLHVLEDAFLPEVIDPATGRHVAPGEIGELVLTTLGRADSPVLRYRTGDLVRSSGKIACACGRHELALAGGILGRSDDMVVVRGVNVYPRAVEEIIRSGGGVAEYQVNIHTARAMTEISVSVEIEPGAEPGGLAAKLEKQFQAALSLRVPVKVVAPGSLPRFEGKARRWVKTAG